MTVGDRLSVQGYITQDKFLVGRRLSELELYLGFHCGRLALGATFVKLDRLPKEGEFELAAYSMTAAHKHSTPAGLDISKLKALAMSRWSLTGPDRLIKVFPLVRHDPSMDSDEQYPPGSGVPQWKIKAGVRIAGMVVAEVTTAAGKYVPAF
jgi:hypothetical protein